jgi:hypothetical protein
MEQANAKNLIWAYQVSKLCVRETLESLEFIFFGFLNNGWGIKNRIRGGQSFGLVRCK